MCVTEHARADGIGWVKSLGSSEDLWVPLYTKYERDPSLGENPVAPLAR